MGAVKKKHVSSPSPAKFKKILALSENPMMLVYYRMEQKRFAKLHRAENKKKKKEQHNTLLPYYH